MKTEINVNNTEVIYRLKNEVNSLLNSIPAGMKSGKQCGNVRKSFALDLLYLMKLIGEF